MIVAFEYMLITWGFFASLSYSGSFFPLSADGNQTARMLNRKKTSSTMLNRLIDIINTKI